MKKILIALALICAVLLGLFLDLSSFTVPDGVDKVLHFSGFMFFTLLIAAGFATFFGRKNLNKFLFFVLMMGGLLSAVSEKLQDYVPIRNCDPLDWLANVSGIAIAAFIVYAMSLYTTKRDMC